MRPAPAPASAGSSDELKLGLGTAALILMGELAAFYLRILTIPDDLARGSSTATIAGYNAAIFLFVFVPIGWLYTRVGISATAFGLKKPLDVYLMPAIACTMPLFWWVYPGLSVRMENGQLHFAMQTPVEWFIFWHALPVVLIPLSIWFFYRRPTLAAITKDLSQHAEVVTQLINEKGMYKSRADSMAVSVAAADAEAKAAIHQAAAAIAYADRTERENLIVKRHAAAETVRADRAEQGLAASNRCLSDLTRELTEERTTRHENDLDHQQQVAALQARLSRKRKIKLDRIAMFNALSYKQQLVVAALYNAGGGERRYIVSTRAVGIALGDAVAAGEIGKDTHRQSLKELARDGRFVRMYAGKGAERNWQFFVPEEEPTDADLRNPSPLLQQFVNPRQLVRLGSKRLLFGSDGRGVHLRG